MRGVHLSRYLTTTSEDGQRAQRADHVLPVAGCGFGGSCLPKDIKALSRARRRPRACPWPLLDAVHRHQPGASRRSMLSLLAQHFPSLAGMRVAVLGLAFRPDTDDMRESPAIPIVRRLLIEQGARVIGYDPVARDTARDALPSGVRAVPARWRPPSRTSTPRCC